MAAAAIDRLFLIGMLPPLLRGGRTRFALGRDYRPRCFCQAGAPPRKGSAKRLHDRSLKRRLKSWRPERVQCLVSLRAVHTAAERPRAAAPARRRAVPPQGTRGCGLPRKDCRAVRTRPTHAPAAAERRPHRSPRVATGQQLGRSLAPTARPPGGYVRLRARTRESLPRRAEQQAIPASAPPRVVPLHRA